MKKPGQVEKMRAPLQATKGGRRSFLRLVALGAGSGLVAANFPAVGKFTTASTETLLLSCVNHHAIEQVRRYMMRRGFADRYEHITLPGASLGALAKNRIDQSKTFWARLEMGVKYQRTRRIIIMDHANCAAYQMFFAQNSSAADLSKREMIAHRDYLGRLGNAITNAHPALMVELGITTANATLKIL